MTKAPDDLVHRGFFAAWIPRNSIPAPDTDVSSGFSQHSSSLNFLYFIVDFNCAFDTVILTNGGDYD